MKISEEFIAILNAICEKIGLAIDWTDKNITSHVVSYAEVVYKKIIAYEITTSILWIAIVFAAFLVCVLFYKFMNRLKVKYLSPDSKETIDSDGGEVIRIFLDCCVSTTYYSRGCRIHNHMRSDL